MPDSVLFKLRLASKTCCPPCNVYTVKIFNMNPDICLLHVRTCRGGQINSMQVFNMDSAQIPEEKIPLTQVFEIVPEEFHEELLNRSAEIVKKDHFLDFLLYLLAAGPQNPFKIITAAYVAELKTLPDTTYHIQIAERLRPKDLFNTDEKETEPAMVA